MAIGKKIRFFRNRKGMTQKQLGRTPSVFWERPLMSVWHSTNQNPEHRSKTL